MAEIIVLDERDAPAAFRGGILDEAKLPSGVLMRVGGRMMLAETPNANKRRYPRSLWEHVLQQESVVNALKHRRMYGELDHPTDRRETSLKEASHVMTTLRLEPTNEVYGEFDILDTPMGRIAAALFRAQCTPGVSTRAEGSVRAGRDGISDVVTESYKFKTVDIVASPSTPGAYPGVLAESVGDHERRLGEALLPLMETLQDQTALHKTFEILNECTDASIREQARVALARRTTLEPQPDTGGGIMSSGEKQSPLIEAAIQGLLDEQSAKFAAERSRLQESLLTEQAARQDLERQVKAAKAIIEAQLDRIAALEAEQPDDDDGEDDGMAEGARVKAAEAIIEELLSERDASHQLIETAVSMLRNHTAELAASKKLLESFVTAKREADRAAALTECLSGIGDDHPRRDAIVQMLEAQRTADDVRSAFEGLAALLEGATFCAGREALPPGGLDESAPPARRETPIDNFASELVARVS